VLLIVAGAVSRCHAGTRRGPSSVQVRDCLMARRELSVTVAPVSVRPLLLTRDQCSFVVPTRPGRVHGRPVLGIGARFRGLADHHSRRVSRV